MHEHAIGRIGVHTIRKTCDMACLFAVQGVLVCCRGMTAKGREGQCGHGGLVEFWRATRREVGAAMVVFITEVWGAMLSW